MTSKALRKAHLPTIIQFLVILCPPSLPCSLHKIRPMSRPEVCLLNLTLCVSYSLPLDWTLHKKSHGVRMDRVLDQDQRWIDREAAQEEEEVEEAEEGVRVEVEKAIGLRQSGRVVLTVFRSSMRPKDMED